jgi:AcrR family transcriptional regulator
VARRARVSRRTVYAHFPSRSVLADAALAERVTALAERVARWHPRSTEAAAVLDEVIAFHGRSYREEYALMETLSEGAPESARRLLRQLDGERLRTITRTLQSIADQLRVPARDAGALIHSTLSYPAWRVALTGPAGRRAPRLLAAMLKRALL